MAKLLEFLGPAGVGKTTLQNHLVSTGGLEGYRTWPWEGGKEAAAVLEPEGWAYTEYSPFLKVVTEISKRLSSQRKRYLRNRLREAVLLSTNPDEYVFHAHEGMASACVGAIADKAGLLRQGYYWTLPAPLGVVVLRADAELVAKRFCGRAGKTLDNEHVRRAKRALRNVDDASFVLETRGVPLLHLDGAASLEHNAAQVRAFADSLYWVGVG